MKSLASQMEFILELPTKESKYSAFLFCLFSVNFFLIQLQLIHLCLLLTVAGLEHLRAHGIQQHYILKNCLRDVVTIAGF